MGALTIIKSLFKPASDLVGKFVTSKGEKLELANELQKIENAMSEKVLEYETKVTELQGQIVLAETTGNKLQRSWRPLLMLSFGAIIIYEYFISSVFSLPKSNLPADFWDLLKIGVGGYVVGRSAEKIVPKIYNNIKQNKN